MLLHVALYPLCLTNTYFIPTLTGWVFRYSDTIEKPFSLLVAEKGVDETPTRGDYQIGGRGLAGDQGGACPYPRPEPKFTPWLIHNVHHRRYQFSVPGKGGV